MMVFMIYSAAAFSCDIVAAGTIGFVIVCAVGHFFISIATGKNPFQL